MKALVTILYRKGRKIPKPRTVNGFVDYDGNEAIVHSRLDPESRILGHMEHVTLMGIADLCGLWLKGVQRDNYGGTVLHYQEWFVRPVGESDKP